MTFECEDIMIPVGSDREFILKVIKDKFETSFKYFMGNGPLASSMYIDTQLLRPTNEKIHSIDDLYKNLILNDLISRSNLILGDSGLGKTTLGLHICQKFWNDHDHTLIDPENDRIPIYIHLPSVIKSLQENILMGFFGKDSSLVDSVAKLKLLFILDGFDELNERNQNIYKINKWGYPPYNDVRVLILSRHEIPQSHKTGLFEFVQEEGPPPSDSETSYSEYVIQPFNSVQIELYIDRFDQFIQSKNEIELKGSVWEMTKLEYIAHGWSKADYLKWFTKFRDLRSLAQTPLILTLIMQTLPSVVFEEAQNSSEIGTDILKTIEKFCKTKVGVFDGFTKSWFSFQYKRLVKAGRLTDFHIHWSVFKEFSYAFGQNVAYSMISRRRDESRGLLQDHYVTKELIDKKFLEVNGNDYSVSQKVKSECVEILKSSKNIPELLEAVRISCLIKYSEIEFGKNEKTFLVSFFHRSLAEYFVSRDLFQGLAGEFEFFLTGIGNYENVIHEENVRGLNSYLLNEEGIILNLADRLKSESDLKSTLFSIIYESRNISLISIMSANAISILNIGGISLSGHDFSWVQIPGANLNHSICGNTNFNGANLENVSFENSWLFGAQFKGANLRGTRFGIVPNIPIENVRHIEVSQEHENWFLYTGNVCESTGRIKIVKWELLTLKKVKEYTTTCTKETTEASFGFNFWNKKYLCVWRENLILFELESGKELAQVKISTDPSLEGVECEFPVHGHILGLASNQLLMTWGNVLKIFDVHLNARGTRNVVEFALKREFTIDALSIPPAVKAVLNTVSKFKMPKIVDFQNNVELGLVLGYVNIIQFVDKGIRMTFDDLWIRAFDIDSSKRQIALVGHLGFVEIWSIDTKVRLKTLRHSTDCIETVIFSPNFKYLISGASDNNYGNSVFIWDNENDWSIMDAIQIGEDKDLTISIRIYCTNNGQTTLAIPVTQSIQLHSIIENETKTQVLNKMITQKKMTPQSFHNISCSIDGKFIATIDGVWLGKSQDKINDGLSELSLYSLLGGKLLDPTDLSQAEYEMRKSILNEAMNKDYPTQRCTIQIYNVLTGTITDHKIAFTVNTGVEVFSNFIVHNRILCILRSEDGSAAVYLVFDLEGNVLKNKTEMSLQNCGFYTTQMSPDGTLLAFLLRNGQIQLFKLMAHDPYIQDMVSIQISSTHLNVKPRFVSFNSNGNYLVSASVDHKLDGSPIFKTAQIHIWNIQDDSVSLRTTYSQTTFSVPSCILTEVGVIMFDLNTLSCHEHGFDLFVEVNKQNNNTVKMSQKIQLELRDIFEITFWFKVKIVKFIPSSDNDTSRSSTKLLVSDRINMSCLQIHFTKHNQPTWSILWSNCLNLNLVVKDLSLNGCISLDEGIFYTLLTLGALPGGRMASTSQEYISKSNLICPILGSSDLGHSSVLSSKKNECLSPSNDNWILSVIGKKTIVPYLKGFGDVKVVSHVFLALEGLRKGRRFIIEAHLYEINSKTYFVLRPVHDLEKFRIENERCSTKQWYRTWIQGERLLKDILFDYQSHWEYKFLTQNCVRWCKRKLRNVGIRFKSRVWDKLIVSPNAVLERDRVHSRKCVQSNSMRFCNFECTEM